MPRAFETEIAECEQSLASLRDQMADARGSWLDVAAPWLAEYWRAQAREIAVDQAEHARSLGAETIGSIKARVEELADQANDRLVRYLVDDQGARIWPDLKPQVDQWDSDFHGSGGPGSSFEVFRWSRVAQRAGRREEDELDAPSQLRAPMHRLQSEVLEPFRAEGFATRNSRSASGPSFRPLELPWTREMANAIDAYAELHQAYLDRLSSLASLKAEQARAEASDLWDSA